MPVTLPDRAPNAHELLAFYLEAGVDCALADEPVNRLTAPDAAPAPARTEPREAAAPKTLMQAPAVVQRGEPTLAPV